jgi:hypothetical protein
MMIGNSEENSNFRRAGYCFILTGKIDGTWKNWLKSYTPILVTKS